MASKSRMPLQVSLEFKKKLDEIQRSIMRSQGQKKSYREITTEIISNPMFKELEESLIKAGNLKVDLRIKLDGRNFNL